MALQPKDLDSKAEENNKFFLSNLEKKIDKALTNSYSNSNPSEITIEISYVEYHTLETLMDILMSMYYGWSIKKLYKNGYDDTSYYLTFADKRKRA